MLPDVNADNFLDMATIETTEDLDVVYSVEAFRLEMGMDRSKNLVVHFSVTDVSLIRTAGDKLTAKIQR